MILVADASFATKMVLREDGSDLARQMWTAAEVSWVAPALVGPEVQGALEVRHRREPEAFGRHHLQTAGETWRRMLGQIAIRNVDAELAAGAIRAIRDHAPLRGADACYLTLAQQLAGHGVSEVVLATFDAQQRRAGESAGVVLLP